MTIPVDNPISDPSQDLLDRMPFATSFSRYVRSLDARDGVVVGVYGPWGSGKTSFLNLTKCAFQEIGVDVLEFNPWHFSGTGQLLNRFFEELSKRSRKLDFSKNLSKHFAAYGELIGIGLTLLPGTPYTFAIHNFVSFLCQRISRSQSVEEIRRKIVQELRKREQPLVIMIDDLDRLTRDEILEVFKLVRLIGRFPELVYIVACDREQVEKALDWNQDDHSGRRYMEKIIQYPVTLPEISDRHLFDQLEQKLKDILDKSNLNGVINDDRWPDIRSTIVFPLLNNLRDVNRFLAVVGATIDDLKGLVSPVDVIALEAVRMFLPDTFIILPTIIDVLTVDRYMQPKLWTDRELLNPHKDSFQFGWNQNKDLKYQRSKAAQMLKYSDQLDSESQDIEQSKHIESMVVVNLIENVFPPTRTLIQEKADEQFTNAQIDDWKRVFIRHVFETYLARALGRIDGI